MGKKKGKDAFDKTVRGKVKKMVDFDQQKEVAHAPSTSCTSFDRTKYNK